MKILLVSPAFPTTFWSFKYALPFIGKRSSYPPLGLLTVAAMLPDAWEQRLVDLEVRPLKEQDILWADYVFIGGMTIQKDSARRVIALCKSLGKPVVAGGPLFTECCDEFAEVDHFVLNEAEVTLPPFLDDLRNGELKRRYASTERADLRQTPIPRWELINFKHYAAMSLQYSRGCPYDCEFCDITVLYGRHPRVKSIEQVEEELTSLSTRGWRGTVLFADDNFIGNKERIKRDVLPAITAWMQHHGHPFEFVTEASLNLADDIELMQAMRLAGFQSVFVGIESPNDESLTECAKTPNANRDLLSSIHAIQRHGLQVHGGFIVGFDHDPPSIFERMVSFIQESGIVIAMVGLLNAPRGTRLYQRLEHEGRLLSDISGDNTDCSINFTPSMNLETLLEGYRQILGTVYSPRPYYARVKQYLATRRPRSTRRLHFRFVYLKSLVMSTFMLGIVGKERACYWRLIFWSLFTRPKMLPQAITLAVFGYHFRKNVEAMLRALT